MYMLTKSISGDYGPNFVGLILGSAVYIARDTTVNGVVAFGANCDVSGSVNKERITILPRDAKRQQIHIADMNLHISISAGAIQQAVIDLAANTVTLQLVNKVGPAAVAASKTVVWLTNGGIRKGETGTEYVVQGGLPEVRGGRQVNLKNYAVQVVIGL